MTADRIAKLESDVAHLLALTDALSKLTRNQQKLLKAATEETRAGHKLLEAEIEALKEQNRQQEALNTRLTELLCLAADGGALQLAASSCVLEAITGGADDTPDPANDPVKH